MLDLDSLAPDWKMAAEHGQACMPGRPVKKLISTTSLDSSPVPPVGKKKHTLCECCLNVIQKEPIPLCQNSKELQFLGFGFPLFFIFTKYAIVLLTLQLVTYSALSISWGLTSSVDICEEGHIRELPHGGEGVCTTWLIHFMRTEPQVTRDQIVLRLSSFIIQLMALLYMRDTIRKTNEYYDERTTSLSDYSILLSNLPRTPGNDKRIREFLQNGLPNHSFVVQQLVQLNQIQEYYRIREEKQALTKQKQKWLRHSEGEERTKHLEELNQLMVQVNDRLQEQHDVEVALLARDAAISEKAIVVLESEDEKDEFLKLWEGLEKQRLKGFFGEAGEEVEVGQAPEPKQIIWENINYPREKRALRLVIGWTLTTLFIGAITGIFYGILTAKGHLVEQSFKDIKQHPEDPIGQMLLQRATAATFLTMLLIILFNKFVLSFVLHIFTDLQKHRTGSEYQFSFGLKYTMGLFFTTALMTLFVEDFALGNIYKQEFGVVQEESIMFFFNAFLVPIIWIINPWYLFKLAKRSCFQGREDYTQRQANSLMEDPKYSMGKKYAELIESVWFTYLYSSVIPGGCVLILVGLVLFYWVDKFTLLRRSSINQNVNGELSLRAMKLIDATLLFRSIGQIIFDTQIRDGPGWQPILCVCIAGVYLLLPLDDILEFFHEEKFRAEEKPYREVKHTFIENYHTMHPLYSKERYALIRGMGIVGTLTNITNVSNNNLLTKENDFKQEMFGSSEFIRAPKEEFNDTKEEIIQIRPAKASLLQFPTTEE